MAFLRSLAFASALTVCALPANLLAQGATDEKPVEQLEKIETEETISFNLTDVKIAKAANGFEFQSSNRFGQYDLVFQFGNDNEVATIYVYTAPFPNAALWFQITRSAMDANFRGSKLAVKTPEAITLGNATAPNALQYVASHNGELSTAAVIAHHGDFLVKFRLTQKRKESGDINKRLKDFVGLVDFDASKLKAKPLTRPEMCKGKAKYTGKLVKASEESVAKAGVMGFVPLAVSSGASDMTDTPGKWCQVNLDGDRNMSHVNIYREIQEEGGDWVALVGDSGKAAYFIKTTSIEAAFGPISASDAKKAPTALYALANGKVTLAMLGKGQLEPKPAYLMYALEIGMGQRPGLMSIGFVPSSEPKKESPDAEEDAEAAADQ